MIPQPRTDEEAEMAFDATTFEIDPQSLTTPRERLIYMRDFLRRLPEEWFDLGHAGSREDAERGFCGSAACIGGWARAVFRARKAISQIGCDELGLTEGQVNSLFFPGGDHRMADGRFPMGDARPGDAATVIDHLLNTGEVDWSVARKAER